MTDHIEHPCRICGSLLHHRDGLCGPCWTANKCDFCGQRVGSRPWLDSGDTWICEPCEQES